MRVDVVYERADRHRAEGAAAMSAVQPAGE